MGKSYDMRTISPDRYFDLGAHTREITTTSIDAQYWFNHGLNWCYGFNQEEGLKCFRKVLEHDPRCAMAHWGIAYASGPFYNLPWRDFGENERTECTRLCFDHTRQALSLCDGLTECEAALVESLSRRFQADHPVSIAEFDAWDDAYAQAMRETWKRFPEDEDVIALYVEAMMQRTPWKLWNVQTNEPGGNADTLECLQVLEHAIESAHKENRPQHPAILHLHIHVLEMSSTPERALQSADTLGTLSPEAGHMRHMPGHIYVLCGLYEKAKTVSEDAILVDRLYREYAGDDNFYTTARCHDLHLMMYACMFLGQYKPALAAAEEMCEQLTPELLAIPGRPQMAITLEGYYSMKMHVLVRFGKWQEIIAESMPPDPDLYLASTPMWHYAKAISYATLSEFNEADGQYRLFLDSRKKIPDTRKIFNNTVLEILSVAEQMMLGEMEYHKGKYETAFEYLRKSVWLADNLSYSEPWAWMHPPRHALGALLLEQGHVEEAEQVYRADLGLSDELYRCAQHPDSVWALHGLVEILKTKNDDKELPVIRQQYESARQKADQEITSSCCCRKSVVSIN